MQRLAFEKGDLNKENAPLIVVGVLLVASLGILAQAQEKNDRLQGWMSYTPSRLDWLAVELNAELRVRLTQASGYSMQFVSLENADTILIHVTYLPSANREVMNMYIDMARKTIAMKVKANGWTSWANVEERVKMVKID